MGEREGKGSIVTSLKDLCFLHFISIHNYSLYFELPTLQQPLDWHQKFYPYLLIVSGSKNHQLRGWLCLTTPAV